MLPRRLRLSSGSDDATPSDEGEFKGRKRRRGGGARSGWREGTKEDEEAMLSVKKPRRRSDSSSTGSSSSSSSTSDSGTDDDSTSSTSGAEEQEPRRRAGGGLDWKIEFGIVLVILLVVAGGLWAYNNYSFTSSSSSSSSSSTSSDAAAPTTSESQTTNTSASAAATPTAAASTTTSAKTPTDPSSSTSSSSSSSDDTTTSAASPSTSSDDATPATGAPLSDFTGITLPGTWADTASYTIATGTYADVPGTSSTMDLAEYTSSAVQAEATKGLIYVGDSTWYAAFGGAGSCGEKLYDGQDIYFAAMSLYHWMGAPGPSEHCWDCVSMQSVEDPSLSITAIIADSCEACEFAHLDLEQRAFYALGGTVKSGTVTVAWEFIDCPDGYSQAAIAALNSTVQVDVDTS